LVQDVNCNGVWLCCKYQLKQMIKQDSLDVENGRPPQRGAIVNCASVNSVQAGAQSSGYSAAKHAVVGITKCVRLNHSSSSLTRGQSCSPGSSRTWHPRQRPLSRLPANQDDCRLCAQSRWCARSNVVKRASDVRSAGTEDENWLAYERRQGRQATHDEIGDAAVLLCSPRM
jgi:NAD(P)-dependent dehydrogenase (short-subunit alcohol dehydrogenase family)